MNKSFENSAVIGSSCVFALLRKLSARAVASAIFNSSGTFFIATTGFLTGSSLVFLPTDLTIKSVSAAASFSILRASATAMGSHRRGREEPFEAA